MKKLVFVISMLFSFSMFARYSYHGNASYYTERDNRLNGHNKTASGEHYNENALTCASNKHKMGTLLRVENIKNNKVVVCRVNDTGAFHRYGRVIDLSKRAFSQISTLNSGVIKVKITPY